MPAEALSRSIGDTARAQSTRGLRLRFAPTSGSAFPPPKAAIPLSGQLRPCGCGQDSHLPRNSAYLKQMPRTWPCAASKEADKLATRLPMRDPLRERRTTCRLPTSQIAYTSFRRDARAFARRRLLPCPVAIDAWLSTEYIPYYALLVISPARATVWPHTFPHNISSKRNM